MNLKRPTSTMAQLYQRPGFLLRRAHQLSVGLFEQQCAPWKLTPPQYGVLYVLAHAGDLDQAGLSRALGFDKVTTLRIVRGLEARGLLMRTASAVDRRRLVLGLTREGRALLSGVQQAAANVQERLLSPLQPAEQAQLLKLLDKLCGGLEEQARVPMAAPGALGSA